MSPTAAAAVEAAVVVPCPSSTKHVCSGGVGCAGTGTTEAAAGAGDLVPENDAEQSIVSLRNKCQTLRIVAQALREKDEENQVSTVSSMILSRDSICVESSRVLVSKIALASV